MKLAKTQHREESHTQNLLTSIERNAGILSQFIYKNSIDIDNTLKLQCIDLQRGLEAESGGDFVLVVEYIYDGSSRYFPIIIQAKRSSKMSIDVSHSNAYGLQLDSLKNHYIPNSYLYYFECSDTIPRPIPPLVKETKHRAIVKCGVWRSCSSLLTSLHFFHSIDEANIFHNIR